jgi:hypothetical protein
MRREFSESPPRSEPSIIRVTGLNTAQPSLGQRVGWAFVRFLTIFYLGIAATLAWQSYGDATRQMIASYYPQLGWLAPQTALAESAPETIAPAAPTATSSDWQELKTISLGLAAVRQSVDQLAAQFVLTQEERSSEMAKLEDRIVSALPRQQPAIAARKPAPSAPLPSSQVSAR